MSNSQTVYLNSTTSQTITGFSPFTLTINPSGIPLPGKIYKITYDFGDGTFIERDLTTDNQNFFSNKFETYVYNLTSNLQQYYNIQINAYQFNSSYYQNYNINLSLRTPPLESICLATSSVSAAAYFNELHLVGSRMFGTEDEILYMFESINPSYLLPVLVNWKARPIESIVKTVDGYLPYKLLAPFENEATTSIETGTKIVTFPDVDAAPNPDYGNPTMKLYEGLSYASHFLGTINGDWFNILNWKTDNNNNAQALPDEFVSVKVFSPITLSSLNVGKALSVDFLQDTLLKELTIMVSQSAIFHSNSYNLGTIQGDAYFLDNSYNYGLSTTLLLMNTNDVDGSQVFTDSSGYNRILTYTGNPYITSLPVTPNNIVTDGLTFQVDAQGYSGDGTKWMDTITGVSGIAQNSPTYVAASPSYFDFTGASQCFNFPRVAFCSVLMNFDDVHGSTTFTDSSNNNLTFDQIGGSPIVSTDQSVFGGSSLYLDGNSYIATANNGLFAFGTKDMTYEAWIYLTDYPTTDNWNYQWYNTFVIMGVGTPNAGDGFDFCLGPTKIFCQSNDQMLAIGNHGMSLNTWYHVAAVVKSGVLKIYVNGNLTGSQAVGSLGGGAVFSVGSETKQGAYFKGYIDDVRVYNGYAAYTSNFTPPTSELTVNLPPQINVDFNDNFSLETWVNVRGNNEWGGIISLATGGYEDFGRGKGEQYSLDTTNGQYFRFDVNSGSYLNGIEYTLNNWTHIITTYQSGVVKTYKNGILADTQTIASHVNSIPDAYLAIGVNQYGGYEYLNGKVATVRIYNKVLSSIEALQNFNATKSIFLKSYPSGSFAYFDGNSHVLPTSGGNDFAFGTEDFTIEGWIFPTRNNGTSQVFYDTRIGGYGPYPIMYLRSGVYLTYHNGWGDMIDGDRVGLFEWTHIAVSRKDGKSKLFINGVQTSGTVNDTNNYLSDPIKPIIGGAFDNYNYKGFIKDFRVTKRLALYTQNFTPPSAPLGDTGYITGNVTGTATFKDSSINYGTLTNTVFSGNNCQNLGIVTNADVFYPTPYPFGGVVTGNLNYHGYVFGCDDSDALNYDSSANTNDGSCTYNVTPLNGLYAYWTLDEASGTRYDSSGNGFDLTDQNDNIGSGNGIINNGATFNGSYYNYLTNNDFSISAGSDFTVCGWVNLNNGGLQELIGEWYYGYAGNFLVTYGEYDNQLGFHVITSNGDIRTYIDAPINQWVFFAMRWKDGVKLEAKINNNPWTVLPESGTLNGKDWTRFLIGAGETYGYYGANGTIDEVGVWTRRLNEAEVSYLYNSGAGRAYPF
jgi:Concanavalin A-like lectin/glucanases superfamily